MEIAGKIAIVTGASSGIGRATALELARRGARLAIAARRPEELEGVASECRNLGIPCLAVPCDVTSADDCRNLVDTTRRELGEIDILVNNAGFATFDPIASAGMEDLERMMQTNYLGAARLTRSVLPRMLERRTGSIVFVASITGIMGFAGMGGYSATKFALIGFAEALRDEVLGQSVNVGMVCPGTTETEFFRIAERGKMPGASRLILAIPPEKVARAVASVIRRNRYRIIVPVTAMLYMRLKETFPRTAHMLMRRVSAILERRSIS